MKQSDKTFEEVSRGVMRFLEERNWVPKRERVRDIAISISLEAAELLEHYQWQDEATSPKSEIADELADVMIYCFQFANTMEIDLAKTIEEKLKKQEKKYPAEMFREVERGSKAANELWAKAKVEYNKRKDTL